MRTIGLFGSLSLCLVSIGAFGCLDSDPIRYDQFAALTVPIDYERPNGKKIQVEYRIDSATKASQGYVLILEGGPGGDFRGVRSLFETALADPSITDNYDRVFLNIRGVGANSTQVQCDTDAPVEDCVNAVAQIAPIESFTTRNFARDIDTLRKAIGIDSWDAVYGISYGTRLAQEYARMFPDHAGKLILDGTVSPALASIHLTGKRLNDSLYQQVFEHCRASATCMAFFSDTTPEAAFERVLTLADQGLLVVTTSSGPVKITREDIIDVIGVLLRSGSSRPLIPQLVRDLGASPPNVSLFAEIAARVGAAPEGINPALLLIVGCNETFRYEQGIDPESLRKDAGVFGVQTFAAFAAFCPAVLDRIPAGKEDVLPELVQSAVPSCIVAGQDDPVTPMEEATAVASQLSQGRFVSFPYAAHGVVLSSCGSQVIRDCMRLPPADVDASCIDREPNPYAYPPATAMGQAQFGALHTQDQIHTPIEMWATARLINVARLRSLQVDSKGGSL